MLYMVKKAGGVIMKKLWFGVSLTAVFVFAAACSYIYFAVLGGVPELDEAYRAAADLGEDGDLVPRITADTEVMVSELYACGYTAKRTQQAGGDFLGESFDKLTKEGWDVARVGENRVELCREYAEVCPTEQNMRLVKRTERGIAIFAGTAEHLGAMLLEMPVDFAELPPDLSAALEGSGYQLKSQAELDELLESLDELIPDEQSGVE